MKKFNAIVIAAVTGVFFAGTAHAVPLTFIKLSGLTGGSPAGTAVYKASLSSISSPIDSISINDNSGGLGGSPGQFSGFDLDAIKISTTDIADASSAPGIAGLPVFDFVSGTTFTPGTQRVPVDPKLFGTGPTGNTVDEAVARLGLFDGNSTSAIPGADGFISLGDNGILLFKLTPQVNPAGLFLYIGEVGDNGEVAASNIQVNPLNAVPEPSTLVLISLGLVSLLGVRLLPNSGNKQTILS